MRHARSDYDRFQDPAGLVPEEEPVLLLRGQDVCAPAAARAWCDEAEERGVDPAMIERVRNHVDAMIEWQDSRAKKVPDLREGF